MTSRNSFSEGALLRDGMRRNLWSIVLSGLGFLFSLLLPTLMTMQNALELRTQELRDGAELAQQAWQDHLSAVAAMLGGENLFVKFVVLVLAAVCGVSAFAYLHSRQKVDFYHSLPISRTRLFFTNFATSALCVLPMYLVMLAVTVACAFGMGFGEAVHWGPIGGAVLVGVVFFLLIYALSALAAILCGNTIISLLLLLWILFAPVAVIGLQSDLFDLFYRHYTMPAGLGAVMINVCPPAAFIELDGQVGNAAAGRSQLILLLAYLLAAVLVTALCWFLFRIRKSERAGTALAFEPAKTPIKIFMCLVAGVAVGLLFNMVANGFWFWPGLMIGAVLFHWLVEIIYAFDFHAIFAKPLHLAVVLVILAAGMMCLKFDVTGYDRWLPNENKIAAVDIDNNVIDPALITPENMEAVRRLAEIGISTSQETGAQEDNMFAESYRYQEITYRLTNGRVAGRAYQLPDNEEVATLLTQISNSEEFKRAKWPLYTFDETDTTYGTPFIEVYNGAMQNAAVYSISKPEQISTLLSTLREETAARKLPSKPVIRLMLGYEQRIVGERRMSAAYEMAYITEADVRSLSLLKQYTGVEPQVLTAETVEKMELHSWRSSQAEPVEVTDPADIALLLADAIDQSAMELYDYNSAASPSGVQLENSFAGTIYACLDDDWKINVVYPAGQLPVETLKKYLPHETSAPDGEAAMVMAEPAA